jgi:hypothetical protein
LSSNHSQSAHTTRATRCAAAVLALWLGACSDQGRSGLANGDPTATAGSAAGAAGESGSAAGNGASGAGGAGATNGASGNDGASGTSGNAANDGGSTLDGSDPNHQRDAGPQFPAVTDLSAKGPFETTGANGTAEGPNCSVHRPATLGEGGLRHPVIIWGMGTGGFNLYQPAFELWASHGFVVAAGLLGNGQGSGVEMLGCLDYVCEHYAPHVDCRAGASGHSQGGGGAIMAAQDPRVITTAPVQPYIQQGFGGFDQASIPKQTGPMLLLSGTLDTVAAPDTNQKPVFDGTNVPVFWGSSVGTDHVAPGTDGLIAYREAMLAWFRIQLMGDDSFRGMFYGASCTLCSDSKWKVMRKGLD